jgi:four helix bundle protein
MFNSSHKNLDVYKISWLLVKEVYAISKTFPTEERFVLVSRLRRAVVSVSSNIAEGTSRIFSLEKKRFYEMSRSSAVEIDTQFEIALLLGYLKHIQINNLENYVESVFRMLSKMINNLAAKTH